MNPLDELELDILAMTGDIEAAEFASQIAQRVMDDLIEASCYMFGWPPEMIHLIRLW